VRRCGDGAHRFSRERPCDPLVLERPRGRSAALRRARADGRDKRAAHGAKQLADALRARVHLRNALQALAAREMRLAAAVARA
jgi:hypothetical protein